MFGFKKPVDQPSLSQWWATPLGQAFIVEEQRVLQPLMASSLGTHALLVGDSSFIPILAQSPILHRTWIPLETQSTVVGIAPLMTRQDKLSIASESIDLVYLAHCLGLANNPHEVLREVFRVLKPEGYLLIANFNPWSFWGLWQCLSKPFQTVPWTGHLISILGMQDGLSLAGFESLQKYSFFFRPPLANIGLLEGLSSLERLGRGYGYIPGGGYVIWAKKPILTLTPIRLFSEIPEESIRVEAAS